MGNCISPASKRSHGTLLPEEEESFSEMLREEEGGYDDYEAAEEEEVSAAVAPAAEGLKVKIVLTRGELEWLMAQLKSGDQRLEDVLHHMQAAKGQGVGDNKQAGWRPRLESILECPEAQS